MNYKKQNITPINFSNIGNGIPKRIITNFNDIENKYNLGCGGVQRNNISKNLFTNYTYKRINLDNNNNKYNLFDRNILAKTPIIRRCKTMNNIELNKNINNITNNEDIKNNFIRGFYINNKYKYEKIDLNNPKDTFKIKILNRVNSYNYNNNTKIQKKDSFNSVKYSVTNDGSTVSIHNNSINGLPIIQGVCAKCINNELINLKLINKKKYTDYNMKSKVDKYLLNNNKISKFSIPLIGIEKFRNKYLPTKEQYINNLTEQIIQKKKTQEKQNKKDKDEFNFYLNKNMIKEELDEKIKKSCQKQKLKELLKENIKLAELKKNKEFLDKSSDIALEKKQLQINYIKDKENKEKQNKIKIKLKLDLKEKLEEQIKSKIKRNYSFNFRSRIKRINSRNVPDMNYVNVYTENKINQYGRCFNCKKLFKKNLICSKSEYDNIKNAEKINEEKQKIYSTIYRDSYNIYLYICIYQFIHLIFFLIFQNLKIC